MIVKSISIRRPSYYGYGRKPEATDPFLAQIEVESPFGEVKLNLDAEMTKRIIDVIADHIRDAGRQTAEALQADVINGQSLLAAE